MNTDRATETAGTLVSVIVPAYNGEKYITKCLSSILAQTYRSLEVIVIDDGSTDRTGEYADALAQQDPRLRVFHVENAGVSAARNRGMDLAAGSYLVFVDADDYLAQDCVEYLVSLLEKNGADMALSANCYTKKEETQTAQETAENMSSEDAVALLLSPAVIVGCWNKIFKKALLEDHNIRFSTDLFYGEGLTFITDAAQAARSVCVGNRKVYYYRRSNDASATTTFDIRKLYNGELALKTIGERISENNKNAQTMLMLHRCLFYLGGVTRLKANHLDRKHCEDYMRWLTYIRKNLPTLLQQKTVPTYRKLMLLGGCISPWLLAKLDILRRKRIFSNSIDG